ncbi:MAG: type II secretion system protein GspE, partial [Elusimicrobia bacterium CG08_land_8_20_14_0_20_59_10]
FEAITEHPHCPALVVETARTAAGEPSQGQESYAVQSVEKLLDLAISLRASDIHLEPQQKAFFVRFRIDGVLKTIHEYPKEHQVTIVSRIKVMAGMDISEKRLPLDGQISLHDDTRNIDLRISTMPGKYGETVVIRILNKASVMFGLEKLGLAPATQSAFEALIERPHGIILVTGPTGSGKTTTLYAVLNRIKSPLINIITLEDPIEYELLAGSGNQMGITQVQVQPKI